MAMAAPTTPSHSRAVGISGGARQAPSSEAGSLHGRTSLMRWLADGRARCNARGGHARCLDDKHSIHMTAAAPSPADAPTRVDYVALPPGRMVGRYEILGVLGQGGFGITYLARDTQLDREVALKEYLPAALAVRQDGSSVLPRSTEVADDFGWGREPLHRRGPHARQPARGAVHREGLRLPRGQRHRLHGHGAVARRDAGGADQGRGAAVAGRRSRRSCGRCSTACSRCTRRASCIATSSPPTSCWAPRTRRP